MEKGNTGLRREEKLQVGNRQNPMLDQQFTLTVRSNLSHTLGSAVAPVTTAGGSYSNNQPIAYTVDSQGTIDFPVLGKLSVAGMTRKELAQYIQDRLFLAFFRHEFLAARRVQNRAAPVDRVGHASFIQFYYVASNQSIPSTANAIAFQTMIQGSTYNSTNTGVHAGSITAAGKYTNSLYALLRS